MTTEQKFDCIFCKDVFDSKEELQVHFRRHADPKFKSKNRFEVDTQVSNEKVKEKAEMVSCDVCPQMFPTISKAITHKHKVHPDHDVKYFCPWCGKLFTMKHPYNIHIQTTHDKQEQIEDKIFHCDCCDVDFFLPSAMIYHNKFFHRQDTDIPDVGSSKKLRLYNQEVLQLYYCPFCGEEHENKVNLFKHITDDHGDENQCPEEVLRCPLCDAIFYHLDAYEIHLSFHTTEDLYSANNELFADLLDFSLETVPPSIEKVETKEEFDAEAQSQDTDVESAVNAVGIEKFLELAMDQTEDSNPAKVKKKKHKKSKKSAITLDEFLSMNQDVFGEGLDFQGVEEVPTRVVAKQFKSNKRAANAAASAELEKLKQKGIVVMKVGSKPTKIAQKQKVVNKPTPNREIKTSSEVLTKLMNQSNNQIKIVKKTVSNPVKNDTEQAMQSTSEESAVSDQNTTEKEIEPPVEKKEVATAENKDEGNNLENVENDSPIDDTNKNLPTFENNDIEPASSPGNTTPAESTAKEDSFQDMNDTVTESDSNNHPKQSPSAPVPPTSPIVTEEKEDVQPPIQHDEEVDNTHEHEASDSEMNKTSDELVDKIQTSDKTDKPPNISPVVSSLSTLKHLSHLTVKPVGQNRNSSPDLTTDNNSETKIDQKPQVKDDKEAPRSIVATNISPADNDISPAKPSPPAENDSTLDALKNLSKNITIKSLSTSTKRNIDETESDVEQDTDTAKQKLNTNFKMPDVSGNKNLTIKKIKIENNEPSAGNKVITAVANAIKNTKIVNKVTSSAPEIKTNKTGTDIIKNSPMKSKTDILKHLPNITTKPLTVKKNVQSLQTKQTKMCFKTVQTSHKEGEVIEISDIDDSDDDTDTKEGDRQQDTPNTVDPLKNLSKHITIKSLNQPAQPLLKNVKVEKAEEQSGDDEAGEMFNSDDDIPADDIPSNNIPSINVPSVNVPSNNIPGNNIPGNNLPSNNIPSNNMPSDNIPSNIKVCSQKLSNRSAAVKNALKNLGKNITIKSRNSSPSQSVKSQDHNSQDSNEDFNEDGCDSEPDTGKVKITELENDNSNHDDPPEEFDYFDPEEDGTKPIVESPHDSGSDNDEPPENDFETEIQASTMQKTDQEIITDKNTICLNNLKNISKSITIKSLNSNFSEKQDIIKPQPTTSQEGLEGMKSPAKTFTVKTAQQANLPKAVPSNDMPAKSRNLNTTKKLGKIVDHTSNETMNQKVSVNKEVTVKTFQTKTVIQEITTTVTKTIKTVNQSVSQSVNQTVSQSVNKQEMRNSSQMNIPVLPQRVQGMKPPNSKNLQGVVIRHAPPGQVRPNNVVAQIRPVGNVVRPSKQIVPTRPSLNVARPSTPRMQTAKNNLPKSSPSKQVTGKPLKFSPSVLSSPSGKRPNTEDATGPFSCFKKPKESLIPGPEMPSFSGAGETMVQMNASHTSTSNYMSTSKIVKGNSVVTATQMKSEVTSMQQLSRVSNAASVKVKAAQVKQTQVQEKSEGSGMKRTTLEAIEKLQKQGLLVKKPRVEEANDANDSEHVDGNVDYNSADEHDE